MSWGKKGEEGRGGRREEEEEEQEERLRGKICSRVDEFRKLVNFPSSIK